MAASAPGLGAFGLPVASPALAVVLGWLGVFGCCAFAEFVLVLTPPEAAGPGVLGVEEGALVTVVTTVLEPPPQPLATTVRAAQRQMIERDFDIVGAY